MMRVCHHTNSDKFDCPRFVWEPPDPKVRFDFLRNELARLELEKSELNAAIVLFSAPVAQKRQAIRRYGDLVAQTHKILSELESLQAQLFRHRLNGNGIFDSICLLCYATAASEENEDDLRRAERDHVCDPDTLRRLYKKR